MRKFLLVIGFGFVALRVAAQSPEVSPTDLYGQLTGRTVLCAALPLPALTSIKSQIQADTNKAVEVIETELAKYGIECVRDGEKFVRWLPTGWRDTAMGAELAKLKPPTNNPASAPARTGEMSFPNISIDQVMKIYSQLSNRTLVHPADLPPITIHLKSQGPLSTDEAIYAFKTLFILNGYVVVEDDDKSAELVPIRRVPTSRANPPESPTNGTPPTVPPTPHPGANH